MSRLLPTNQALKEQRFAEFVDESLIHDNSVITLDPLTCHFSLLEHIALGFGASIAGMNENEARLYLSKIERIKTQRGTAGAVEDTLAVTFEDAELVEWFEDRASLEVGEFGVEVVIKADASLVYDKRKFKLSKWLINQAKNVRSHLKYFKVRLPPIVATVGVSTLKSPVMIHPYMDINELLLSGFGVDGGWVYEPTLQTNINEALSLEPINTKGGYRWQVEV